MLLNCVASALHCSISSLLLKPLMEQRQQSLPAPHTCTFLTCLVAFWLPVVGTAGLRGDGAATEMALLGDSTEIFQGFDPWEVLILLSPEPQGSSR